MTTSIPNELLDHIFGLVGEHGTLHSLSLASRTFNTIARPHLYKTLRVGSEAKSGNLEPLVRTLTQNPALGELVSKIYIDDLYDDYDEVDAQRAARTENQAKFHTILAKAHRSEVVELFAARQSTASHIRTAGEREDPAFYPWLELLLISMPKLRAMEIVQSSALADFWSRLRALLGAPDVLRNVEIIQVEHSDTKGGVHMEELGPLLKMTQPKELGVHPCVSIPYFSTTVTRQFGLRKLRLEHSFLSSLGWKKIAINYPLLEELVYTSGPSTVIQYKIWEEATPHEVGEKILSLRTTLRKLVYDTSESGRHDNLSHSPDYAPFESFKTFTKLESLAISLNAIATRQGSEDSEGEWGPFLHKLPPNLQVLGIPGATKHVADEYMRLAEIAKVEFPSLTTINIHDYEIDDVIAQSLKLAFMNTAITIQPSKFESEARCKYRRPGRCH